MTLLTEIASHRRHGAVAMPRSNGSRKALLPHEPAVVERFEIARDHLRMARLAALNGSPRSLARREVARALSEIRAASRALRGRARQGPSAFSRGSSLASSTRALAIRLIEDLTATSRILTLPDPPALRRS